MGRKRKSIRKINYKQGSIILIYINNLKVSQRKMSEDEKIDTPLVVDLDGTLIKTDLLFESINYLLTKKTFHALKAIVSVFKGKHLFKSKLALQFTPDFSEIPINKELLEWLKIEHKKGRTLILATASHKKYAMKAADFFGFFDDVIATDEEINLKSKNKRDFLVERFGEKGFDYVGDSKADKPVWKAARYSYAVSPSKTTYDWLYNNVQIKYVFENEKSSKHIVFLKSLRPHQWAKNLLIFIPLLTSHLYNSNVAISSSVLAFIIFCTAASSAYLLNDLSDLSNDRNHPRKCHRPLASGELSILSGWLIWPLMFFLSLLLAVIKLPVAFVFVLITYYSLTVVYSLYLKTKPIIDVIVLAMLYTLRIIAGTSALDINLSFWLLSFSMFVFLSLAFVKRVSEFKALLPNKNIRVTGRGYLRDDFEIVSSMGVVSGFSAVVFLSLYVHEQSSMNYYTHPEILWLLCPLLLFWIVRIWLITHRGGMFDDPVVFVLKDKLSRVIAITIMSLFVLARYL